MVRASDVTVLGAHATFVGSILTDVKIFIWIMSPLWSKKISVIKDKYHNSSHLFH